MPGRLAQTFWPLPSDEEMLLREVSSLGEVQALPATWTVKRGDVAPRPVSDVIAVGEVRLFLCPSHLLSFLPDPGAQRFPGTAATSLCGDGGARRPFPPRLTGGRLRVELAGAMAGHGEPGNATRTSSLRWILDPPLLGNPAPTGPHSEVHPAFGERDRGRSIMIRL